MSPSFTRGRRVALVALVAASLGSCTADSGLAPSPPEATASPSTSPGESVPPTGCVNPDGGACLNDLAPGTYTTADFEPALTYTVPDGWFNAEDLYGNFQLLRPADVAPEWQANYIGVYRSPRIPAQPCEETVDLMIAGTVEALHDFYTTHDGLTVTGDEPVVIGGLEGRRLDLELAADWTGTCPYSAGEPVVPFAMGSNGSGFHHNVTADIPVRLYLLEWGASAIGIEVAVDTSTTDYAAYMELVEPVVESFVFDVG